MARTFIISPITDPFVLARGIHIPVAAGNRADVIPHQAAYIAAASDRTRRVAILDRAAVVKPHQTAYRGAAAATSDRSRRVATRDRVVVKPRQAAYIVAVAVTSNRSRRVATRDRAAVVKPHQAAYVVDVAAYAAAAVGTGGGDDMKDCAVVLPRQRADIVVAANRGVLQDQIAHQPRRCDRAEQAHIIRRTGGNAETRDGMPQSFESAGQRGDHSR